MEFHFVRQFFRVVTFHAPPEATFFERQFFALHDEPQKVDAGGTIRLRTRNQTKPDELSQEILDILKLVAEEHWPEVHFGDTLRISRLAGSLTNQVFACHWTRPINVSDTFSVLLRLFGKSSSNLFDRDDEQIVFDRISLSGIGPKLFRNFNGGRIEEYLNARTLMAGDLQNPQTLCEIAKTMRKLHKIDVPISRKVNIWKRIRNWMTKVEIFLNEEEKEVFQFHEVKSNFEILERNFPEEIVPPKFCHNDLQYGNIMEDQMTKKITFIDYEYSSYNSPFYDIANFFCEITANYHSKAPHLLDFTKFPVKEVQLLFLEVYFDKEEYVPYRSKNLLDLIQMYTLLSHIHWALWAIICSKNKSTQFDYSAYGKQRISLFLNLMKILF